MWLVALLGGVAFIALWWMVQWLARRQARQRQMEVSQACTPAVLEDSIYVLLPAVDSRTVGTVLHHLFHHARCPRRVFVEVLTAPDQAIMPQYWAAGLGAADGLAMTHVICTPWTTHLQQPFAGYHGERFVWLLDGAARVVPQWDELLLDEWRRLPAPSAWFSTLPTVAESVWTIKAAVPRLTLDRTASTAPYWLWQRQATVTQTLDVHRDIVLSEGWSYHCSFAAASVALPLLRATLHQLPLEQWDFAMSQVLTSPHVVYTPTRHLALR